MSGSVNFDYCKGEFDSFLTATFHINQEDLPVTIFWNHIVIAGTTKFFFGKPESNEEESSNDFWESGWIAGNPQNTFAMRKNENYFSGNQMAGNILKEARIFFQEAGKRLKEAGNVLKEEDIFLIISGNILKEAGIFFRESGNKLKEDRNDLKILGEGTISVETFRKFEIRSADFREYPSNSHECG